MTNQVSFNNIQNWLRRTDRYASEGVSKFLVGMKCDLVDKRVVAYETAKDLADSLGMDGFMEVSAQNNINVDECFWMVVVCLLSRYEVFFVFSSCFCRGNLLFFLLFLFLNK